MSLANNDLCPLPGFFTTKVRTKIFFSTKKENAQDGEAFIIFRYTLI
ncbi:MAG: hypothetical protein HQ557_17230 [Bacteroidetes bacterium]|nr:hypothetical protein [Bacteroidota bacterium]